MRQLLISAILAVVLHGASIPGPSRFYIVLDFFSDNGAIFYYRVIDVRQDGNDSIVRYSRIAPAELECPQRMVQAAEARVHNISPAELVKANNPCAIEPKVLKSTLKKYRRRKFGVFETMSFGVVAQCGSSTVALGLPTAQKMNWDALQKAHPEMARLWNLSQQVIDPRFGQTDIFQNRTAADNAVLQRAGAALVPELASGQYDAGLELAVRGNVNDWKDPSFRSLLADYKGPIDATQIGFFAELLNAHSYHFSHYAPPVYPPLAKSARVQGRVELQITLNSATGEVLRASAISGHPLLIPTAISTAQKWRFSPESTPLDSFKLTLNYALQCRSAASVLTDAH